MSRKLRTFVHVDGVAYGPDDKIPADVAKQITNPKAWADGSADDDGGAGDEDGFDIEKANKGELEAEVDRRNADRADDALIVVEAPGNKAELKAALAADDAATA